MVEQLKTAFRSSARYLLLALGTISSTFLIKWNVHLCQNTPVKFSSIAFTGPLLSSDTVRITRISEFDPLEWMAALISHIPDKGAQTVYYYGYYSNATRGRLKKEDGQPVFILVFVYLFMIGLIDKINKEGEPLISQGYLLQGKKEGVREREFLPSGYYH